MEQGRDLMQGVGRHALRGGKGLPARAIPVDAFHIASIGIDLLLGAICYGASQVAVVSTGREAESYGAALSEQMDHAETILNALGYAGRHFELIRAESAAELERALWSMQPAKGVSTPAGFNLAADKRGALDFELDHLARHAPAPQDSIALARGAPFGALALDRQSCTLCKACIGACPEAALQDAPETPALRFIERNCVQCGLCADTCPEGSISLVPRLLLTPQAKQAVTLNEAEPYHCVRCGKPFGTRQLIDSMLGKLAAHSMFAGGGALRRLQMCADCRVIDLMEGKDESSILDYTGRR